MKLHELSPVPGSHKKPKRLGQGLGSGNGKTAGKGHKGQKARKSPDIKANFEGGQMPLARRIPKRGFNNRFRKEYVIVNLASLADLPAGTVVDHGFVLSNGLAKDVKNNAGLKVLGAGELAVALTVRAAKFSATAKEAIEKAGGTAETV